MLKVANGHKRCQITTFYAELWTYEMPAANKRITKSKNICETIAEWDIVMEKSEYFEREELCRKRFDKLGEVYHVCTPENHSLLFTNNDEFRVGMTLFALCALKFPEVKILTFQLMSNHIHFAAAGKRVTVEQFINLLFSVLRRHPVTKDACTDLNLDKCKIIPIESLENLQNVIAYINRNGFVVNCNTTPFSYPWGANRYYFNPDSKLRYEDCNKYASSFILRTIARSRQFDSIAINGKIKMVDDSVCPLSFCYVQEGEQLFRDAHHYFSKVAKNVESYKEIALSIGESQFFNDEDLFSIVISLCFKQFNVKSPSLLSPDQKTELARTLHFTYKAGNKQIARMLKLKNEFVDALFP